ncbi:MAG: hypothetical protein KDK97_10745, partial [Verrucomicrobiales bacterium]|nr:hypothetical protein [Verrucomicrobiales bacterium]
RLDDRLDAPLVENPGHSFRETFESCGSAGDEDAGLSIHWCSGAAKDLGQKTILLCAPAALRLGATL